MARDHEISAEIARALHGGWWFCATRCKELGDRYQQVEEEYQQIPHGSAGQGTRLSGADLFRSSLSGENRKFAMDKGGSMIKSKFNHQQIADRVGASREMISKILKDRKFGGSLSAEAKP